MVDDGFRVSEHVRIKPTEEELLIQTRAETGRGKRYGMDGEIALSEREAERLAKWVFARELAD